MTEMYKNQKEESNRKHLDFRAQEQLTSSPPKKKKNYLFEGLLFF